MGNIKSCEFNMDTGCVELCFADGGMIAIDCIALENEVADNLYERSELDYLIYNDPVGVCQIGFERRPRNVPERCHGIHAL